MAKHYVVSFRPRPDLPPEEIRVKAPTEAAAEARLRAALRAHGHDDTLSVLGAWREATENETP